MMTVQITCPECQSSIEVYAQGEKVSAKCDVCSHIVELCFNSEHGKGELKDCPVCQKKDFYIQKDFKRSIGITLFVIASILSIWTYGISFIVLYAADFFLFRKLRYVAVCYKCQTIFRNVNNVKSIPEFNLELHDRVTYSGHEFEGKGLGH